MSSEVQFSRGIEVRGSEVDHPLNLRYWTLSKKFILRSEQWFLQKSLQNGVKSKFVGNEYNLFKLKS